MMFDKTEWRELLSIDDEMDPTTRMLLFQYSSQFDSVGRAVAKPKVLGKMMDVPEKEVRKHLTMAKDAGWLEPIEVSGKKGYQATVPQI